MKLGLYQKEIVILNKTDEGSYVISSDRCFTKLKESNTNLRSHVYKLLKCKFEYELNMTLQKMVIGCRILK